MPPIRVPAVEAAPEASKPLLEAVRQQLGIVPNLFRVVGNSPAALEGYLSLSGALGKGKVPVKLRESIALAVAEYNGCNYCLSAHTYLSQNVAKLTTAEIDAAREGGSSDARTRAALQFARRVAASRGHVTAQETAQLREAGFDDEQVIEIVANVALNVLTNYVNSVAQTEIDFPLVVANRAA
jgi:uncharacterized peroxidase-related enzyme